MRKEKLAGWVEKKLQEGVSKERLRETLEKKGYDPSIVDEVSLDLEISESDTDPEFSDEEENNGINISEKPSFEEEIDKEENKPIDLDKHTKDEEVGNTRVEGKKEHLEEIGEDIGGRIRKDIGRYWKPVAALVLISGLIFGAWMFVPFGAVAGTLQDTAQIGSLLEDNDQNTVEDPNSKEKTSGYEGPKVILNKGLAEPGRVPITYDQELMFVSNVGYPLEIEFESDIDSFRLGPRESKKVDINSLVYYTAKPVDAQGEPEIKGSAYVE